MSCADIARISSINFPQNVDIKSEDCIPPLAFKTPSHLQYTCSSLVSDVFGHKLDDSALDDLDALSVCNVTIILHPLDSMSTSECENDEPPLWAVFVDFPLRQELCTPRIGDEHQIPCLTTEDFVVRRFLTLVKDVCARHHKVFVPANREPLFTTMGRLPMPIDREKIEDSAKTLANELSALGFDVSLEFMSK